MGLFSWNNQRNQIIKIYLKIKAGLLQVRIETVVLNEEDEALALYHTYMKVKLEVFFFSY